MRKRKKPKDEAGILARTTAGRVKGYTRFAQVVREHEELGSGASSKEAWYDKVHSESTVQGRLAAMVLEQIEGNPSTVIDFGCGTGLSGLPFIERGYSVDGIDFSAKMAGEAKKRGYRQVYSRNIATVPLRLKHPYDVAISCGVAGDWVPFDIVARKMAGAVHQNAVIGMTSDASATDIDKLERILRQSRFRILAGSINPGAEGKAIMQTEYYFVVAGRI